MLDSFQGFEIGGSMWLARNPRLAPLIHEDTDGYVGNWWPYTQSLKWPDRIWGNENTRTANSSTECNRPAALTFAPKQDKSKPMVHCYAACNVCYRFPLCRLCLRSSHPADATRKYRYCADCWYQYIEHCSYCGKQSPPPTAHTQNGNGGWRWQGGRCNYPR